MLAWNVLSNNEFEFTNDYVRGREIVMDKYLELKAQCTSVVKDESNKALSEDTEVVDLSQLGTKITSDVKVNMGMNSYVSPRIFFSTS